MSYKPYDNKLNMLNYDAKMLKTYKRCQSLKLNAHCRADISLRRSRLFFISAELTPLAQNKYIQAKPTLPEVLYPAKKHAFSKTFLGHLFSSKKTLACNNTMRLSKVNGCALMLTEVRTGHIFKTKWQLSLVAAQVCPSVVIFNEQKINAHGLKTGLCNRKPSVNHTLLGVLAYVPNYQTLFISFDELVQAANIKSPLLGGVPFTLARKICIKSNLCRALLKKSVLLINHYTRTLPV